MVFGSIIAYARFGAQGGAVDGLEETPVCARSVPERRRLAGTAQQRTPDGR